MAFSIIMSATVLKLSSVPSTLPSSSDRFQESVCSGWVECSQWSVCILYLPSFLMPQNLKMKDNLGGNGSKILRHVRCLFIQGVLCSHKAKLNVEVIALEKYTSADIINIDLQHSINATQPVVDSVATWLSATA